MTPQLATLFSIAKAHAKGLDATIERIQFELIKDGVSSDVVRGACRAGVYSDKLRQLFSGSPNELPEKLKNYKLTQN